MQKLKIILVYTYKAINQLQNKKQKGNIFLDASSHLFKKPRRCFLLAPYYILMILSTVQII